jgi:uncharacterized RDD family membrane protein YckC
MAVAIGRLEITTSDHVVLRYDLAGPGNRGFAAIVDFLIALLMTSAIFGLWMAQGQQLAPQYQGLVVMLMGIVGWGYFILLEWLWNGQTIGKRLLGLRVIGTDGAPASFAAILVRNFVRIVDFLPAFYGVGLAAIALSPRSQRLGDLAAGTFVVRAPRVRLDWLALRTPVRAQPTGAPDEREAHVDLSLSGEAQRLVREFVSREATLAPADRAALAARLAAYLRPRVRGIADADDVALIRAVAAALRARGGP